MLVNVKTRCEKKLKIKIPKEQFNLAKMVETAVVPEIGVHTVKDHG